MGFVDNRCAVRQELTVGERPRQQHVVGVRRKLEHDARATFRNRETLLLRELTERRVLVGLRTIAGRSCRRSTAGLVES